MLRSILITTLTGLMLCLPSFADDSPSKHPYFGKTVLTADPKYKVQPQKYICTAYDLSIESCGKAPDHPAYGLTASGVSLKNKSWNEARAIAVDPRLIKLGTKVLLIFHSESRKQYNGVYTAVDTGGDIKQKRIDVFIPERKKALQFGVTEADVYILR